MKPTKAEKEFERRLRCVIADAPDGVWIFAAQGTLNIMRYGKDGKRVLTENGCMSQTHIVGFAGGVEIDGGDW